MIKLKDLLASSAQKGHISQHNPATAFAPQPVHEGPEDDALNESLKAKFEVHSDPDRTERSFVSAFEELAKGHGGVIDYGPRESDMYDWKNRNNYKDAIKEYNSYMVKIAMRLNSTVHDMNNIYKVWGKINDKYRKKDKGK